METIGFIGLGTVGGMVAASILKAGYGLAVYDVRTEAMQPVIDVGAESAASPADVARRCRIVLTSLPGPAEVEQVALSSTGILHGVRHGSL